MTSRYTFYAFMLIALLTTSCRKRNEPAAPDELSSGIAIYYSDYYKDKGVDAHVWEMEFYSGTVESTGNSYKGTGQILTFTDVFSPAPTSDAILHYGTYKLTDSHEEFTAIPGMEKDGYDLGAYLTIMIDGQVSGIEFFTAGSFDIQPAPDDSIDIHFDLQRRSGTIYHNHFRAPLPLYTAVKE